MKFEEVFDVSAARERVWEFFDLEAERVGMCIPGAEEIHSLGDDKYRLKVAQKVGSMGATFDLRARIRDRQPTEMMSLSATGRSVKGARGDIRATAVVSLEDKGDGTTIRLDADVALGGMIGSLGHKVIAQKAEEITRDFAVALGESMNSWTAAS